MELPMIVPELLVEDVERAIDFYARALGFKVSMRMPEAERPMVAQLGNGSARVMLLSREFISSQVPNLPARVAAGAGILMLPIPSRDDVREAYHRLAKEVSVVLPLREVGNGGVEFAFADPDGNMIVMYGQ